MISQAFPAVWRVTVIPLAPLPLAAMCEHPFIFALWSRYAKSHPVVQIDVGRCNMISCLRVIPSTADAVSVNWCSIRQHSARQNERREYRGHLLGAPHGTDRYLGFVEHRKSLFSRSGLSFPFAELFSRTEERSRSFPTVSCRARRCNYHDKQRGRRTRYLMVVSPLEDAVQKSILEWRDYFAVVWA